MPIRTVHTSIILALLTSILVFSGLSWLYSCPSSIGLSRLITDEIDPSLYAVPERIRLLLPISENIHFLFHRYFQRQRGLWQVQKGEKKVQPYPATLERHQMCNPP